MTLRVVNAGISGATNKEVALTATRSRSGNVPIRRAFPRSIS
jgi:hypothetical protein